MVETYEYIGDELELFAHAVTWKSYFHRQLRSFIQGDVLEVGAGIGTTTRVLREPHHRWTCLEPDPGLAAHIPASLQGSTPSTTVEVIVGTLHDLSPRQRFDTILYIDVLEHIEDDVHELNTALHHLHPGGCLIILSPAYQWLFSPFDATIGHYRRYDRQSLQAVIPSELVPKKLIYLDAVGLCASIANRFALKQEMPTPQQIGMWDRYLVPLSKYVDPLLGRRVGKSIVGVWQRPGAATS